MGRKDVTITAKSSLCVFQNSMADVTSNHIAMCPLCASSCSPTKCVQATRGLRIYILLKDSTKLKQWRLECLLLRFHSALRCLQMNAIGCYTLLYLSQHDGRHSFSAFIKYLKPFELQSRKNQLHFVVWFLTLLYCLPFNNWHHERTTFQPVTCFYLISLPMERENEPYVSMCMKHRDSSSMMSVNVLHVFDNASHESQQAIRLLGSTLFSSEVHLFQMCESVCLLVCLSVHPSVFLSILQRWSHCKSQHCKFATQLQYMK